MAHLSFHLQMLADFEMEIEMIDLLLATIIKSQVRYEERIPLDAKNAQHVPK
jgi:hypothetical protein